jgi:hypothetical protein
MCHLDELVPVFRCVEDRKRNKPSVIHCGGRVRVRLRVKIYDD